MRLEVTSKGVARNHMVFVTEAKAGRPRKTAEILKSKKVFATGKTRKEAIAAYLKEVGFEPANCLK